MTRFFALIAMLSLTIALAPLFANLAWADCTYRSVTCDATVKSYGWRAANEVKGRLWPPRLPSCNATGPRNCPKRPGLSDVPEKVVLKHDVEKRCRTAVELDFENRKTDNHCSTPGVFDVITPAVKEVFGKSACMEHDICYSMPGTNQVMCDAMFLRNMKAMCEQYYFGHVGKRKALRVRNVQGYGDCLALAHAGFAGVKAVGSAFFGANDYPACK